MAFPTQAQNTSFPICGDRKPTISSVGDEWMSSAVLNNSNLSHHLTGYISSVGDEWMSAAVLNISNLSNHVTGHVSSVGDEWMSAAVLNICNPSHHVTGYKHQVWRAKFTLLSNKNAELFLWHVCKSRIQKCSTTVYCWVFAHFLPPHI